MTDTLVATDATAAAQKPAVKPTLHQLAADFGKELMSYLRSRTAAIAQSTPPQRSSKASEALVQVFNHRIIRMNELQTEGYNRVDRWVSEQSCDRLLLRKVESELNQLVADLYDRRTTAWRQQMRAQLAALEGRRRPKVDDWRPEPVRPIRVGLVNAAAPAAATPVKAAAVGTTRGAAVAAETGGKKKRVRRWWKKPEGYVDPPKPKKERAPRTQAPHLVASSRIRAPSGELIPTTLGNKRAANRANMRPAGTTPDGLPALHLFAQPRGNDGWQPVVESFAQTVQAYFRKHATKVCDIKPDRSVDLHQASASNVLSVAAHLRDVRRASIDLLQARCNLHIALWAAAHEGNPAVTSAAAQLHRSIAQLSNAYVEAFAAALASDANDLGIEPETDSQCTDNQTD